MNSMFVRPRIIGPPACLTSHPTSAPTRAKTVCAALAFRATSARRPWTSIGYCSADSEESTAPITASVPEVLALVERCVQVADIGVPEQLQVRAPLLDFLGACVLDAIPHESDRRTCSF